MLPEYIYLHGFASSPLGTKAQYLRQCLAQNQITLKIPDLNQGDFFNLTLTRQLKFIEREYLDASSESELDRKASVNIAISRLIRYRYQTCHSPPGGNPSYDVPYPIENRYNLQRTILIGSSFGGLTSAILGQRSLQVNRLVLLAPAFQFHLHLSQWLGEAKMQQWQTDGSLLFPHYGENCELPLSYKFWTDLVGYQYEPFSRQIPTLILHGIHDEVIPIESSREFAAKRPWVELQELDSDHGLGNVVAAIWQAIQEFCQI